MYRQFIIKIEKNFRLKQGIDLPDFGQYATGIIYFDKNSYIESQKDFTTLAASLGITVLGWRLVPTNSSAIGMVAKKSEPLSYQVFIVPDNAANFDEIN